MNDHLKQFATHSAYEAVKNNLDTPNVVLCTQEDEVHYNPYVDPCQQYDYVEIAGIKWATKNVGACDVTDPGLYFQWGDTQGYTAEQCGSGEGQKYFGWEDYKYGNGESDQSTCLSCMKKYNSTDGKMVLDPEDDAATQNWGNPWRMPTKEDFIALGNAVNVSFTDNYQNSGVSGLICTDKTDSSKVIFFPKANSCRDGAYQGPGTGYDTLAYWSSTCYSSYVTYGYRIMYSTRIYWNNSNARNIGYPIRPVRD